MATTSSRQLTLVAFFAALLFGGCTPEQKITTASPEALRLYKEGVIQFEKFYYREARESIDGAIAADSGFCMAWARRAQLSANMSDEVSATADIDRAFALAGRATRREQLFIQMWHHRLHYAIPQAMAVADSLAHEYPDEREVYLFRGMLYELDKNLDAAIKSYQQAVDVDSGYAQAVMILGYAYSTAGDQEKALAMMQRYIRLAPEAADPRASYADLLLRDGRFAEALEQYQKSLELKSDYWYSVQKIGDIYGMQGRLREAKEQYQSALKMLPQSPRIAALHLVADARLNLLRGQYDSARVQCRDALQVDSTYNEAVAVLILANIRAKEFGDAAGVLARLHEELEKRNLTQSLQMVSYHLLRARLLTEKGSLAEALAECESALQFSAPLNRSSIFRQQGEIFLRLREFEPALEACEDALALTPNAPEVLLTLFRIYHAKGDLQMASEIGGRLLSFWEKADPDYQNALEVKRLLGLRQPA